MQDDKPKNDAHWRRVLDETTYYVTRQKGTEPPFSGEYNQQKGNGVYHCVCCGQELFDSQSKYDSGSGWPSFFRPLSDSAIAEEHDRSHGMERTEIQCSRCAAHLGHVFPDGPAPTGLRYCVNSLSLKFQKNEGKE